MRTKREEFHLLAPKHHADRWTKQKAPTEVSSVEAEHKRAACTDEMQEMPEEPGQLAISFKSDHGPGKYLGEYLMPPGGRFDTLFLRCCNNPGVRKKLKPSHIMREPTWRLRALHVRVPHAM